MALNRYIPANFNQTIAFGNAKSVLNKATGVNVPTFSATTKSLYCMPYTRSNYQTLSILGTDYEDTIQVVIRHNPAVTGLQLAQYKGVVYDVVTLSADDAGNPVAYDIVTLKKSRKVVGTHA